MGGSPDREYFVTREQATTVLDACPNIQWRALVGLARLAGLRVPSETRLLTWASVDWGRGRLTVRSPKTERYEGHDQRETPIVPKLAILLQDAFDAAEEGQERVITLSVNNLQRDFQVIVRRAGLQRWPRPFQVCRQSLDTEWKMTYPDHAVDEWLGHSREVSGKHYLMVPDELFDQVAGLAGDTSRKSAAKSAAVLPGTGSHGLATGQKGEEPKLPKKCVSRGLEAEKGNAPCRARTYDSRIKSPLLCQTELTGREHK